MLGTGNFGEVGWVENIDLTLIRIEDFVGWVPARQAEKLLVCLRSWMHIID